jgi:hypothetical protein
MFPWDVLAIPSRGRPDKIVPLTLNAFRDAGCMMQNVEVWVPEEEQDAYRRAVRDERGVQVRAYSLADAPGEEALNLRVARNLIAKAYDPGTDLVCSDDDIISFHRLSGDTLVQADMSKVIPVLRSVAAIYGGTLFGVYPVANHFFMNQRITTDLRYIVGAFFGYTVIGDPYRETVLLDDKEDFERTCRFYSVHAAVVRADHVCLKTNYYGQKGGMQLYRTDESVRLGAERLHEMFPLMTKEPAQEKSGKWEVKLDPPAKGRLYTTQGRELGRPA